MKMIAQLLKVGFIAWKFKIYTDSLAFKKMRHLFTSIRPNLADISLELVTQLGIKIVPEDLLAIRLTITKLLTEVSFEECQECRDLFVHNLLSFFYFIARQ